MANDSFFIAPKSQKRKRAANESKMAKVAPVDKVADEDAEPIDDYEDLDLRHSSAAEESGDDDEYKHETAQEKRIRMAKQYIAGVEKSVKEKQLEGFDAADLDRDLIAERLHLDALESQGKLKRFVAKKLATNFIAPEAVRRMGSNRAGHQLTVTCAAITPNDQFLYSGSKDGNIIKWDVATGKRLHLFKGAKRSQKAHNGHIDHVFVMAISTDGQFLATGGMDKRICIWSVPENKLLHTFTQHRDAITGLAFKKGENTLFSASRDRTVKVFNVDELAYVETLFGHQDEITHLCSMGAKDRCLSTGGRDRSVRLWKILEESQLVFRVSRLHNKKRPTDDDDHDMEEPETQPSEIINESVVKSMGEDNTGSVETIAWLDDETWITGTDGGVLSLWSIQRKKPIFSQPNAHGRQLLARNDSELADSENANYRGTVDAGNVDAVAADVADRLGVRFPVLSNPFWITAIAAVPFSDLIVTGSFDGKLRFWRRHISGNPGLNDGDDAPRKRLPLEEIASMPIPGFINSLQFSASGRYLIVATGKEHRFGRWQRIAAAKNAVFTVDLGTLFTIEK